MTNLASIENAALHGVCGGVSKKTDPQQDQARTNEVLARLRASLDEAQRRQNEQRGPFGLMHGPFGN